MRVVICDDHPLLLEALSATIARAGHTVEAATLTPGDAVAAVHRHDAEALLIDLTFPDGNGLEAAREVLAMHPRTKVVVLTGSDALEPLQEAIELGVAGYIRKDRGVDRIINALERSGRGEQVIDEALLKRLSDARDLPRQSAAVEELTSRERDVARLLEEGLDTTEIVARLGISDYTVRTHVQGILSKLCVHSRLEAVAVLAEARLPRRARSSAREMREGQCIRRPY